jgi:predicted HD phosphohydrolase
MSCFRFHSSQYFFDARLTGPQVGERVSQIQGGGDQVSDNVHAFKCAALARSNGTPRHVFSGVN